MHSPTIRTKHDQLVGVRLDQADARRLRELAEQSGRPPAQLARHILSQVLRADPEGARE